MVDNQFRADIQKFVTEEYFREVGAERIKYKPLRDKLVSADIAPWSHRNRICVNMQIMKHSIICDKTHMATACIKVTSAGTSCIIGFVHGEVSVTGVAAGPAANPTNTIKPLFIVNSPTYRSQDGEYRGRLIDWDESRRIYEEKSDIFSEIENMVIGEMERGKLSFQADFFYPFGYKNGGAFEALINESRTAIRMFVMCWFCDMYHIHFKAIENHVNPAYQLIIHQAKFVPLFEKLYARVGDIEYNILIKRIAYVWTGSAKIKMREDLQCGQKIFPLTAMEAVKMDDINYPVWREIHVTNIVSNLVLNLISPCFPFINNWFFIQNAHAGMFDNKAMHDKYIHSGLAAVVSSQLKNTDKYNYVNEDPDADPISGKFYRLSSQIRKSIVYADSDIKLSDIAICMTSEYVGRTLRDIPALIASEKHLQDLDFAFSDQHLFAKHMFEFVFSFYAMNTKVGVIHGDLHMNNACLNRLYYFYTLDRLHMTVNNPHICYILNDTTAYVFPHRGIFSTLIDFSRAILGDYTSVEKNYGTRFADMYFADQRLRSMQILYAHFPKLVEEYRTTLEAKFLTNFGLMFKILSVIDTYTISFNMETMFKIDEAVLRGQVKLSPEIAKILAALVRESANLLEENIRGVAAEKITSEADIEWPNLVILKKIFAAYLYDDAKLADKTINVVEIFNYTNPVKNKIEDPATWGPLLSLDKILEIRRKYKMELPDGEKKWLDFVKRDESAEIAAITAKYEQESAESLKYEAWMYQ